MEVYPHGWSATNDQFNQERARSSLPLAWLVRINDTANTGNGCGKWRLTLQAIGMPAVHC